MEQVRAVMSPGRIRSIMILDSCEEIRAMSFNEWEVFHVLHLASSRH